MAIKSLYSQSEVCACANGEQSKSCHVGVGLRQGCVLSPLLSIIYINWMDKLSRTDECVTIGRCKICRLFFADDLVLLASSEFGLHHALNGFAAACDIAGMKISTSETEVLHHFEKSCPMFFANWRCIIVAGGKVQVSWDCTHE